MKARVPLGPGKRLLLLLLGSLCCVDVCRPSWFFRDAWLGAFAVAFVPITTHSGSPTTPRSATKTVDAVETGSELFDNNDLETVQVLTRRAIFQCGTPPGYSALSALHDLCQRRLSYDFDSASGGSKDGAGDDAHGETKTVQDPGEGIISKLTKFLPDRTTKDFLQAVRILEEQGFMSTNPDSVDGLPSLHLNLVSNGKPLYTPGDGEDDEGERGDEPGASFASQIHKLYELVRPFVYDQLLPEADRLLQSQAQTTATTSKRKRKLRVSDVFLRRYGQDICGSVTRQGISIHYDVYSRVTAVVALDEVAAQGTNGLFTLQMNQDGKTSNHKALRRFFPLQKGDCVLHTWDVLHGVDVEAGLDRTSLIVWFDEEDDDDDCKEEETIESAVVSPWLSLEHQEDEKRTTLSDGNDVRQFVLASALSSTPETEDAVANALYLASASQGNAFALTRMGSICEEGPIAPDLKEQAFAILDDLRPLPELPAILGDMLASLYQGMDRDVAERTELACRFWLEASLWGNPLAQKSLADEVMFVASQSGNPEQRVLAATLFALASQQDSEEEDGSSRPSDALARAVEYDVAAREVSSQEEFLASPVVQTARAAHGGL